MFTWLYNILGTMLKFFSDITGGSYALALLLYALVFKIVFLPFSIKQQKNQIALAKLTPKIQLIKAKYKGRTDQATMRKQQQEIMELQQEIAFELAEEMVGRILTVMIEGKVADEDTYVARTYRDAPNVDGFLFLNTTASLMTGDFVKVLVVDANEYDLIGEMYHE